MEEFWEAGTRTSTSTGHQMRLQGTQLRHARHLVGVHAGGSVAVEGGGAGHMVLKLLLLSGFWLCLWVHVTSRSPSPFRPTPPRLTADPAVPGLPAEAP